MRVMKAPPLAAPPMPMQEEKQLESQYELPEEFKRWYDQLFDNVLLYHFKKNASATQSTDEFVKKLYAGEVLWRRGYNQEVLRTEKWRSIKNISKNLEILDNPVLYRREVIGRFRLMEFLWQFTMGVVNIINIYYVFYGFPVFESLYVALTVALFVAVVSAFSIRHWITKKIEMKLSQAPEKHKFLSHRLALIKERWGGI